MKFLVATVKFGDTGIKVELNTCDSTGDRNYQGWMLIPADNVTQYAPGEVYELILTKVEKAVAAEASNGSGS